MDWGTLIAAFSFYFMGIVGMVLAIGGEDRNNIAAVIVGYVAVAGAVFGLIVTNLSMVTF